MHGVMHDEHDEHDEHGVLHEELIPVSVVLVLLASFSII